MPVIEHENELLLRCACGDRLAHVAHLVYEPDESRGNNLKGEMDDWYLSMTLDPRGPVWRRIWLALRFIWRPQWYCGYAEIVLRNDDIDRIVEFVAVRRLPAELEKRATKCITEVEHGTR